MQCKMFSSKRFHNFLGPLNEAKSWVWCTLVDTILILSDQWTLLFVCLFHSPYRSGYFIYHSFHLFFGFWTLTKFYIASFWPKPFWILSLKFCARRNEDCVSRFIARLVASTRRTSCKTRWVPTLTESARRRGGWFCPIRNSFCNSPGSRSSRKA